MLGDAAEHTGADLLLVVEREHKVRPTPPLQDSVGSTLPFDRPSDSNQCGKRLASFYAPPPGHAAAKLMSVKSAPASPFSTRSATTRSAKACALAFASADVRPYARTPGSSGTSAIQRPSASFSSSTVSFIGIQPDCTRPPIEYRPHEVVWLRNGPRNQPEGKVRPFRSWTS